MVQIRDADTLEAHIKVWEDETVPDQQKPVGFMLSLEGADSLVDLFPIWIRRMPMACVPWDLHITVRAVMPAAPERRTDSVPKEKRC